VLDVYYTREPMEVTEKELAQRLTTWMVHRADIESNNGGRGFSRAVARILSEVLKNYITIIKWFTQTKNKKARIITMAPWVMENMFFPVDWKNRWPEYYHSMNTYQRDGVNAHDDAEDCTTAIAEKYSRGQAEVVTIRT
jgi:predicted phage terminase large subunit-like protein